MDRQRRQREPGSAQVRLTLAEGRADDRQDVAERLGRPNERRGGEAVADNPVLQSPLLVSARLKPSLKKRAAPSCNLPADPSWPAVHPSRTVVRSVGQDPTTQPMVEVGIDELSQPRLGDHDHRARALLVGVADCSLRERCLRRRDRLVRSSQ